MKYAAVISMLAVLVAAETINELVDQIPTCAVNCIRDAAQTVNCDIQDFACSCSKITQLTPAVVSCLATSGCSSTDQAKVFQVTPQICAQVGESNQVTAAGTAATTPTTGTATGAAVTSTTSPAAAGRMQVAGWAGAIAAAAAFAL
ncbi:CFEM domain-containing protein [Colletotrichum tofieldiae]|uniref:CFEM domain-containing protein n=1 Tax=Colletotrichum tofieldiae TaxID=708197 RepID=A0A161YEX6_9PEZI|nr:CFEM domain-containing protein [Colletotrichum tofieldiae]GKT91353.1 CFEM domain-containing protein [Colletotrichum tofieldiae]